MKTSFSLRVDKNRVANESMDQDYFNNYMRQSKIDQFKKELEILESQFVSLKESHIGKEKEVKLTELIKVPSIAKVLQEIRDRKRKIQKLEFAMKDSLNEVEKENE